MLFCLFIQLFSEYLFKLSINNIWVFHLFNIGQYVFLCLLFGRLIKNKLLKKSTLLGTYILPFFLLLYYIFNPDYISKFNVIEILVCNIPLLIYSFYFFIERIDSVENKFIYFNAGFFVYTLCSTLYFSAGNIESNMKNIIWFFNLTLYTIYQIFIFVEWYKNVRPKNEVGFRI